MRSVHEKVLSYEGFLRRHIRYVKAQNQKTAPSIPLILYQLMNCPFLKLPRSLIHETIFSAENVFEKYNGHTWIKS